MEVAPGRGHLRGLRQPGERLEQLWLCVYDETGGIPSLKLGVSAPAGGMCGSKACWKQLGGASPKGFKYQDPDLTPSGTQIVILKAGAADKAKILVKGKGANLPATTAFPQDTDVTAQLVRSDGGVCWQAVYPAPALKNSGGKFKDKIP